MILILSELKDKSTNHVIQWLEFHNQSWIRINKEDSIDIDFNEKGIVLKVNNTQSIYFDKITSFWYRRGFINYKYDLTDIPKKMKQFMKEEKYYLINYLLYLFEEKNSLGSLNTSFTNKLITNKLAEKSGLKIPKSYLLKTRKELKKILEKHQTITKVIAGSGYFYYNKSDFGMMYTKMVDDLKKYPKEFAPSYFQEYINKKYELRIFFLKDTFYSMAIFSQKDKQTKIDFRNYNKSNPNRNVPFNLPFDIEVKLKKLMSLMKLNTASIDMIVTDKLEFFFLEVNPIGQFGMVSYPCNYNLEEKVAQKLIEI